MPTVRQTIRQTMIRVRARGRSDISAGSATYGTWNSAKALEASTKVTATQAAAPAPVSGERNIAANATGRASAPASRIRVRRPVRSASRSLAAPTSGLNSASQALGRATTSPARPAGTPSASVMK